MKKQIRAIVEGILDELARGSDVWRVEWIASQVLKRFKKLRARTAPDREFYNYCAYTTVRSIVTDAIRKRVTPRGDGEEQLIFEGFPRVQEYYDITRDGEWMAVPVLQMSGVERTLKVAELRRTATALLEHAEQLELFFEAHPAMPT